MSLETPSKIRMLQRKLYLKAKAEPNYRFYLLYDKIYREDVFAHAYELVKANQGAPGVDGQTFEQIESQGLVEWLDGIGKELRAKTYKPQPVRRVMIPKPGGGERPLGIPSIKDRVVQTAAKLMLEPIFEADFDPDAYGYRPKRSAQDAIQKVHTLLCEGYSDVVDADLSKYFDTIPHCALLRCAARRIVEPGRAASDQDVAEGFDRRAGRAREQAHDGRQEQHLRDSARWCGQPPDAGNPHVRFDERGAETGDGQSASYRAVSRLY
jgi:RNA-directed DNA polymerase